MLWGKAGREGQTLGSLLSRQPCPPRQRLPPPHQPVTQSQLVGPEGMSAAEKQWAEWRRLVCRAWARGGVRWGPGLRLQFVIKFMLSIYYYTLY